MLACCSPVGLKETQFIHYYSHIISKCYTCLPVWKLWNILTFNFWINALRSHIICQPGRCVVAYVTIFSVMLLQKSNTELTSSGLSPDEALSYNIQNIVNISRGFHYISWFITQCKNTSSVLDSCKSLYLVSSAKIQYSSLSDLDSHCLQQLQVSSFSDPAYRSIQLGPWTND